MAGLAHLARESLRNLGRRSADAGSGDGAPGHLVAGAAARQLKGEDVTWTKLGGALSCAVVCDGHQGAHVAQAAAAGLHAALLLKLPALPARWDDAPAVALFAEALRRAVAEVCVGLDNRVDATTTAGCTLTAALVTGRLLTVANLGDSSAFVFTGVGLLEATVSHRLQARAPAPAGPPPRGCRRHDRPPADCPPRRRQRLSPSHRERVRCRARHLPAA